MTNNILVTTENAGENNEVQLINAKQFKFFGSVVSAEMLMSLISIDHITINLLRLLVSLSNVFRCARNIFGTLKLSGKLLLLKKLNNICHMV